MQKWPPASLKAGMAKGLPRPLVAAGAISAVNTTNLKRYAVAFLQRPAALGNAPTAAAAPGHVIMRSGVSRTIARPLARPDGKRRLWR